jgi:hypothetical protein
VTIAASTALVTRTDAGKTSMRNAFKPNDRADSSRAMGWSLRASENVSAVAIAALLRGVKCFSMLAIGNRAREEINMTNTKL